MIVLGWDTATPATAVAALDLESDATWAARHDPAPGERPGHVSELLGLATRMLAAAGAGWGDVARLAAGTGPGSFTGLRIGLATGRALALARDVPLVGVSTLRALAASVEEQPEYVPAVVLAVLDARRGEAFAAAWREGSEVLLAPTALAPEALARRVAELPGRPVTVGDGAVRFRAELEAAGAVVPDDSSPLHRIDATQICRLARDASPGAPEDVLPEYVRAPDAKPSRP